jgi:hypothetical protein
MNMDMAVVVLSPPQERGEGREEQPTAHNSQKQINHI